MDCLTQRYKATKSLLCIGLDPQPYQIYGTTLISYLSDLINKTHKYALAYKANMAYFEQFGVDGHLALSKLRSIIPPDIPLILDSKRGDIGISAEAYAKSLYNLGADIVTVNPYMGSDSVLPFIQPNKGVFALCKTSNRSSVEIQDLIVDNMPLYIHVARLCKKWGVGLVVGATTINELGLVRNECPNSWILAPGIGAQGGDLEKCVRLGTTPFGGIVINVGRDILKDPETQAKYYYDKITHYLSL